MSVLIHFIFFSILSQSGNEIKDFGKSFAVTFLLVFKSSDTM